MGSIINMFLLRLWTVKERGRCMGRREKSSSPKRPEIAWPSNINFEGDSRRCRKSPENFECPRNRGASSSRVYKGVLTWGYHQPHYHHHQLLSAAFLSRCSLLLLRLLFSLAFLFSRRPCRSSFFPSSAIMIPTRSRSVIILMASCTRRPSGARQKEHRGDAPYAAMLVVRSGSRVPCRVLYGKRGFARVNSHGFASRSFIRPVLSYFLIKLMWIDNWTRIIYRKNCCDTIIDQLIVVLLMRAFRFLRNIYFLENIHAILNPTKVFSSHENW